MRHLIKCVHENKFKSPDEMEKKLFSKYLGRYSIFHKESLYFMNLYDVLIKLFTIKKKNLNIWINQNVDTAENKNRKSDCFIH